MEDLGAFAFAAHHVDPLGVGLLLGNIAGVCKRFSQRGALFGHDQGAGLLHLAQHKDLVEAAVGHVEDVAGLQQGVLLGGAVFVHGLDIYPVGDALAGEQHAAVVGFNGKPASAVNRLEHGHGDVGHVLLAGFGDFAHHVDALAAEGSHAHVELDFFDVLGKPGDEEVSHLAGGFAGHRQGSHVGIENGAVLGHHRASRGGITILAGRGGELGVVPHNDGEHVTGADLVVHRRGVTVLRLFGGVGGGGVETRTRGLSILELLDDQFGVDGLDLDVIGRGFGGALLFDRQLVGRLLAHGIGAITRHHGAGPQQGGQAGDQDAPG